MAFTLLLGFLVALPSFGIDMSLPALTSMGAALGVAPERAGLMMSLFMLGFVVAPLFYGPVSDRYRLHAVRYRRHRLRLCSVAANDAGMARRAGCRCRRQHDDRVGDCP
jgi:MFS family permease